MFSCVVCGAKEDSEEVVDDVFCVSGQNVLVRGIPAVTCTRCGDQTFSSESAERVRVMVHGEARADKAVPKQVYEFAF